MTPPVDSLFLLSLALNGTVALWLLMLVMAPPEVDVHQDGKRVHVRARLGPRGGLRLRVQFSMERKDGEELPVAEAEVYAVKLIGVARTATGAFATLVFGLILIGGHL